MNEILFRTLLLENEGTRLDFKGRQYPVVGATDAQKSELLKDILAFANAWRTEPAYILLGVAAGAAGERELRGLEASDQVDDAILQQLINSKINRELSFSYRPFSFDGKTFGVIEIPVQKRPFFATSDFGRVRKNVIYFRRGSSTAEADPGLVVQMGSDDALALAAAPPSLILEFADIERRFLSGTKLTKDVTQHAAHDPTSLPEYGEGGFDVHGMSIRMFRMVHREFWRELADYVRDWRRFAGVAFAFRNQSAVPAKDVRIVVRVAAPGIEIRERSSMPEYPKSHFDHHSLGVPAFDRQLSSRREGSVAIERRADHWEIVMESATIRPQETIWIPEPVFIACATGGEVEMRATAYAANVRVPIVTNLQLTLRLEEQQPLSIAELEAIHDDAMLSAIQDEEPSDNPDKED